MDIIKKYGFFFSLLFLPFYTLAATDPIKWALTQSFPQEIISGGGTYIASYTFTSQIPFPMVNPLSILKVSNSPAEFSYDDQCTGKKLRYLESCTVTIYLKPITEGMKSVTLTQSYNNDRVPLPQLKSSALSTESSNGLTGVISQALPTVMDINSSSTWSFTYTNNGTSTATGLNLSVFGSSYTTNCGQSLAPSSSCTVQGSYTALSSGMHSISARLSFAQGSPILLRTSTTINTQSGGLVCMATIPLAPETLINSSNQVTLLCTNKSGGNLDILSHITSYPNSLAQGVFTPTPSGGDNCTAQVLPDNASCQLSGIYVAPASPSSGISISLSVNYQNGSTGPLVAQTASTTDVVAVINNVRTINLVNQCSFDVWWSMVGGAITNTPACTSNSDCPSGSSCNVAAQICYYNNYGPTQGSYELTANGGTASTQIIQTDASTLSDQILWKGLISASTQCSGTSCLNNDCQSNGGSASCAVGVGFAQPATEAEFTFMLTGSGNVDTYDISNVNGFSMPISMGTNQSPSDYNCGTAGNNLAAGSLKACQFSQVTPPTNMYYWVTDSGTGCTSQNTCSASTEICGLAFDKVANNFTKTCGNFLGYWAANEICQTNPHFSSPFGDNFNCSQYLSSPFPNNTYTLTQLFKCSPPNSSAPLFNSCYLNYSGYSSTELMQCCGCSNWTGIATPSALCPSGQSDPQWTQYIEPLIRWMKQACPTSYSYPYDDKASTFQCTASDITEYTITFCPGGGSGLPSGKTDGR